MVKEIIFILAFLANTSINAQSLYPVSGNTVKDIAWILGAINGAKIYAEQCFSTNNISSRIDIENIGTRLRSYEQLEIEMHYYFIREIIKLEKQTSSDAAINIQNMLLKERIHFVASIDPKMLNVICANFAENITNKTGDFKYIYAKALENIRESQ